MGTTADKLNKILETKQAIKQAIIDKGGDIDDKTVFADYPSKITSIPMVGVDPIYEALWNGATDNGKRAKYLFYGCDNLTTLDLSNFDTSNITDMSNMFYTCYKLTGVGDLSNWNTSNVTNMNSMFYQCNNLTTLDVSNWDTSNVTNMEDMFKHCKSLTPVGISNFDTSNVTNMSGMFSNCYALTSIDVNSFDTGNVTNLSEMFHNCTNLTTLDVSNWDISKVTSNYNLTNAFDYCPKLVDFYPPKNISAPMQISNSKALSHDSLMRIINNLITVTSTKKLTLGTTNKAKLTAEEIAIATNKGWTIA